MSVKVISGIAGSVTTIGGGIGIYLFHNSKNDTNNPPRQNLQKVEQILLQVKNI